MRTLPFRPLVYFLIVLLFGGNQCYAVPLRVHPTNPRYFIDGNGRAVYLTGSHTHHNFQDFELNGVPQPMDFNFYLDYLTTRNHNFVRLWMMESGRLGWMDPGWTMSILPYQRTGPGTALDGLPKFDLTRFDQSYFDRLRARVIGLGNRGIYVDIMLFEGFSVMDGSWVQHPFNSANNINGINGDGNIDGNGEEVHTLANSAVTARQRAFVQKVIETVNDLDNVLLEIANETNAGSAAWQYSMIQYVKQVESGLPNQHPVGMTTTFLSNNAELFNSPADWISPTDYDTTPGYDYSQNPPAATGSKVIILDTDHMLNNVNGTIKADGVWVWKSFLRGLHPIYMDLSTPLAPPGTHWFSASADDVRWNMGYTRRYAERVNLAAMTPRGDLTSTTYALANPGSEYLVFRPGSGNFTVNLAAGTYAVEWFNPATDQTQSAGTVTGGANRSFSPPFSGPAVLYLVAVSQQTPASVTFTPTQPAPGQAISVTATGGPVDAADWVGVFKTGTSNDQYLDWKYLNNTQSVPSSAVRPGIVTINAPAEAGTYEFRFFSGAGDVLLVTSSVWTITAVASRCDFNDNGSADSSDMQLLVNALLANSTSSAYDLNRDSKLNVLDVQTLVNVILGTGTCPL